MICEEYHNKYLDLKVPSYQMTMRKRSKVVGCGFFA